MKPTTELDTLSEESYKDSTLIMQLLRDNLVGPLPSAKQMRELTSSQTLWTSSDAEAAPAASNAAAAEAPAASAEEKPAEPAPEEPKAAE